MTEAPIYRELPELKMLTNLVREYPDGIRALFHEYGMDGEVNEDNLALAYYVAEDKNHFLNRLRHYTVESEGYSSYEGYSGPGSSPENDLANVDNQEAGSKFNEVLNWIATAGSVVAGVANTIGNQTGQNGQQDPNQDPGGQQPPPQPDGSKIMGIDKTVFFGGLIVAALIVVLLITRGAKK